METSAGQLHQTSKIHRKDAKERQKNEKRARAIAWSFNLFLRKKLHPLCTEGNPLGRLCGGFFWFRLVRIRFNLIVLPGPSGLASGLALRGQLRRFRQAGEPVSALLVVASPPKRGLAVRSHRFQATEIAPWRYSLCIFSFVSGLPERREMLYIARRQGTASATRHSLQSLNSALALMVSLVQACRWLT